MKQNTTHSTLLFGALFAALFLFLPTSLYAATTTNPATSTRIDTSVRGVCLRVVSLENTFKQRLTAANTFYTRVATERAAKLRAQATQRNSEDLLARKTADEKLKGYVSSLRQSAQGDTAKLAAIDAFQAAVTQATLQRREAADTAQKTFMTGMQLLADARFKEVTGGALNFQMEISTAFAGAKKECDSGSNPEKVRDDLHAGLASIDQKYRARLADQSVMYEGIHTLTTTRTQSLISASATFSASLDGASQTLHTVLQ